MGNTIQFTIKNKFSHKSIWTSECEKWRERTMQKIYEYEDNKNQQRTQ